MYRLHRFRQSLSAALTSAGRFFRRSGRVMSSRAVAAALFGILALGLYARYVTDVNLFVIKDAGRVTVHESYTRDPQQALEEAGIHINKYDYVSLPDGPNIGRASEIQIIRAHTVTVTMDGSSQIITTLDTTVDEALRKAGYVARDRDILSHPPETLLEDGMEITVTRIDILTETVEKDISFEEVRNLNKTIKNGEEIVTSEGANGKSVTTYTATYRDGVLISKTLENEEIVIPAQNRVIEVGTYVSPTPTTPSNSSGSKPSSTTSLTDITNRAPKLDDMKYSKVLEVTCTAYTTENKKWKWNYMGRVARVGTIAVDPKVIPLGSKVYIQSTSGSWIYGVAVCEDTGGSIKGNKIDLFFDTYRECINFGVRKAYVYILE